MRRDKSQITTLILHCAATPNGAHFTAEDIDAWHAQRGFHRDSLDRERHEPRLKAIGYQYVIYVNGALRNGRAEEEVGAHCKGLNSVSIGVCLIGTDQFTVHQWANLRVLVEPGRVRIAYPTGPT